MCVSNYSRRRGFHVPAGSIERLLLARHCRLSSPATGHTSQNQTLASCANKRQPSPDAYAQVGCLPIRTVQRLCHTPGNAPSGTRFRQGHVRSVSQEDGQYPGIACNPDGGARANDIAKPFVGPPVRRGIRGVLYRAKWRGQHRSQPVALAREGGPLAGMRVLRSACRHARATWRGHCIRTDRLGRSSRFGHHVSNSSQRFPLRCGPAACAAIFILTEPALPRCKCHCIAVSSRVLRQARGYIHAPHTRIESCAPFLHAATCNLPP